MHGPDQVGSEDEGAFEDRDDEESFKAADAIWLASSRFRRAMASAGNSTSMFCPAQLAWFPQNGSDQERTLAII